MYTPNALTCPGSLVWATSVSALVATCEFCSGHVWLDPGDRSGTVPAHDARDITLPAVDLPSLIAEAQLDVETRTDPLERDIRNAGLARLIFLYQSLTEPRTEPLNVPGERCSRRCLHCSADLSSAEIRICAACAASKRCDTCSIIAAALARQQGTQP